METPNKVSLTGHHFALVRILMGCYLTVHFSFVVPYAVEMFGDKGAVPSVGGLPKFFPNLLNVVDGGIGPGLFVTVLTGLSFLLILGFHRRLVSALLWYGWACLALRNPLVMNASLPYIGWVLLAFTFIPKGEAWSLSHAEDKGWEFPRLLYYGFWAVFAAGYAVSGFDKLSNPHWVSGAAFHDILTQPLARDFWLVRFLASCPEVSLKLVTWTMLLIEVSFLPLAAFSKTRVIPWLGMLIVHTGLFLVVGMADYYWAMVMVHLFTFDPGWVKPRAFTHSPVVLFDGVCGLCNGFIDFVMANDRAGIFQFSPIQGEFAKSRLSAEEVKDLDTVYLISETRKSRSSAVLRVLEGMGGLWRVLGVLGLFFPLALRNWVYGRVVSSRYDWFGKRSTCRLPTPEERARFLD